MSNDAAVIFCCVLVDRIGFIACPFDLLVSVRRETQQQAVENDAIVAIDLDQAQEEQNWLIPDVSKTLAS
jgi:hypothetical protein